MKEFKDSLIVVDATSRAACDSLNVIYRDVKSKSGKDFLMLEMPESGFMDQILDTLTKGNVSVFIATILDE